MRYFPLLIVLAVLVHAGGFAEEVGLELRTLPGERPIALTGNASSPK